MHRRIGGAAQREIKRIVALDLSEESHGNANGIGMADITTAQALLRRSWEDLRFTWRGFALVYRDLPALWRARRWR